MRKVLIIGNPNVGKSTLFNSLTKSSEHTGNFHGVTVDSKSKSILLDGENLELIDLPGMYSLNSFSDEERVAREVLISTASDKLVLVDANCLRKNMYLILQMIELGIDFKILINNYDYFIKHGNKLNFEKLQQKLNINIEIINAKKIKINNKLLIYKKNFKKYPQYLEKFIIKIKNKFNLDEKLIIKALNGFLDELNDEQINYVKEFNTELIQDRYHYIDELLDGVVIMKQDFIYGYSKLDKFLLNPVLMTIGFSLLFLLSIYIIFFLVGGWLSDGLSYIYERIIVNPFMDLIVIATDNVWLIEFFQNGVFSSIGSVLGFLPQVCLLFIFLTILEDSGLISRMAYVFDDFLSMFGLNGKALYIMLMGLGCNSMSTMASRNMGDNNLRIKSAIINPYISCMARLPVYVVIASAFFGVRSYMVVAGLYLLGFVVALIMSLILTRTILPKQDTGILLEFPPLRNIDIRHVLLEGKKNSLDMTKRIFSVVLCMGVIVWILSHTCWDLRFTQNMTDSIMFTIADKLSFIFAPIGLNTAGVVLALVVGIMAKELIISTMSICNNATTYSALSMSLLSLSSVVSFSMPSVVSFLIFTLLYCPCISNIAVLKKETDNFFMWFSIISQFTIAYLLSFVVYQTIVHGPLFAIITVSVIALILVSIIYFFKKFKKNKCLMCGKCK